MFRFGNQSIKKTFLFSRMLWIPVEPIPLPVFFNWIENYWKENRMWINWFQLHRQKTPIDMFVVFFLAFSMSLNWISCTKAIQNDLRRPHFESILTEPANPSELCYKKCNCPDEETVICSEMTYEDLLGNIFRDTVTKM